jgi:hypothetical protein
LQASADSAHANDPTLVAAREELARIRLGGGREAPAQPRSTTSAYLSGLDDLLAKYGREAARPTPSVPANGTNNNTDVPAYRNPGFELVSPRSKLLLPSKSTPQKALLKLFQIRFQFNPPNDLATCLFRLWGVDL